MARHEQKFIGPIDQGEFVSLERILGEAGAARERSVLAKLDIEGGEYAILEALIRSAPLMSGLIIELHDVNLNVARLKDFVSRFPLKICHIHANNCAWPITKPYPDVIEVSFTPFELENTPLVFPHGLDRPNAAHLPDVAIEFA